MSQYFKIFNHTKESFITPSTANPIGLCSTPTVGGMLLYLLTEAVPPTEDTHNLVGSWIGDEIRIQGDYHETGIYDVTKPRSKIEVNGEEYTTQTGIQGPVDVEKSSVNVGERFSGWSNADMNSSLSSSNHTSISFKNRELLVGDKGIVNTKYVDDLEPEPEKNMIVTYKEDLGTMWSNQTEEVFDAFSAFISDESWIDEVEDGNIIQPDMILQLNKDDDENNKGNLITGSRTIISPDDPNEEAVKSLSDITSNSDEPNYLIINEDTSEYFIPTHPYTVRSAITGPVTNGMLTYLLFDSVQDGTRFTSLHNPFAPELENEMAKRMEKERERYQNKGRQSLYRKDDGSWNKPKLANVIAAGHTISEDFLYAGRWQGDSIRLISTTSHYSKNIKSDDEWINITDRLEDVFAGFVSPEWIDQWRNIVVEEKSEQSLLGV